MTSTYGTISEIFTIIRTFHKVTCVTSKVPEDGKIVALCHALTAGYIGERYPDAFRPVSLQAAKAIIKYIVSSTRRIESSSDILLPELEILLFHMNDALPNRKLFITKTGQIGLGPSRAEAGDKVVSVIGSQRLMLLRSVLTGFRVVGVCYLHGFMDLEAILGPLPIGCSVKLVAPCNAPWDMRFVRDGQSSPQDPRLKNTHEGWRSDRRHKDGAIFWDHVASRIATKSDPRHTDVAFLRGRGIAVREICIL